MLLLTSTSDIIRLVTSATGDIDVHASFIDLAAGVVTAGRTNTNITTATTTTLVAAPAASTTRNVKTLMIQNVHASTANTLTIQHFDGATSVDLESVTLAAGERIAFIEGVGFRIVDATGVPKVGTARPTGAATIAQIASHSADTYYLGHTVTGRLQAGSGFRWTWRSNKGGGTATPIYTIRFGTNGTTADTARVTITGAAQTAVADEGYFVVDASFRSVGASAVLVGQVALWHRLATTGFSVTATNVFATPVVSGTFDSTIANSIIGLSVNPGTAGAWVTDLVTLDAVNLLP